MSFSRRPIWWRLRYILVNYHLCIFRWAIVIWWRLGIYIYSVAYLVMVITDKNHEIRFATWKYMHTLGSGEKRHLIRFPRSSRVRSCEFWFHSMKRMVTERLIIYCHQKIYIDSFYSGCHQDTIWNFDPSSHKRLDKVHLSMGKQSIWNDRWTETDQSVNHDDHSGSSDVWNVQIQCVLPINFGYASSVSRPCPG